MMTSSLSNTMNREDFSSLIRDKVQKLEKLSKNGSKSPQTEFTDKIKELGINYLKSGNK